MNKIIQSKLRGVDFKNKDTITTLITFYGDNSHNKTLSASKEFTHLYPDLWIETTIKIERSN